MMAGGFPDVGPPEVGEREAECEVVAETVGRVEGGADDPVGAVDHILAARITEDLRVGQGIEENELVHIRGTQRSLGQG